MEFSSQENNVIKEILTDNTGVVTNAESDMENLA